MESSDQRILGVRAVETFLWRRALLLLALWVACELLWSSGELKAQAPRRDQVKDFVFPATDDQGHKTTIYGQSGRPLANGQFELNGMRVETFRGQQKDMIIEAPQCFFDPKSRVAFSSGELVVRTADQRFSIQGRGFRWQQADSRLMISNEVHTVIRKRLLTAQSLPIIPSTARPAASPSKNAQPEPTQPAPSTGETIEVDSDYFEHSSDVAIFRDNVRVKDPDGKLSCGILKVMFDAVGGKAQRIEAEQKVVFEQKDVYATGDRAVYTLKDELVTFSGNPTWKIAEKEGSGELIIIDNKAKSFRVQRRASVKLLPDKMLPLDWLASGAPTNAPTQTNQPITILADELDYKSDLAVFRGNVQINQDRGGSLTCGVLTNIFSADGKLIELIAEDNVEFKQGNSRARGQRAVYRVADELVTLTGNPTWRIEQGEGKADLLTINPKTQKIRAEQNVVMKLLSQAMGSLDLPLSEPRGQTNSQSSTPQEIEVFAEDLQFKAGSAIFVRNVRLTHPQDPGREMTCEVLAAFFVDPNNKLDQIIAEDKIVIRQNELRATGEKVVYWVPKGFMKLTGDPQISTPSRRYKADTFILDRATSVFRMKGHPKVEIERGAVSDSARLFPHK